MKGVSIWCLCAIAVLTMAAGVASFVHPSRGFRQSAPCSSSGLFKKFSSVTAPRVLEYPIHIQRQRRSVSNIQTMGLFGLGAPEIGIILIAAAFLIGPQQLGKMVGQFKNDLNDAPDDLKKIPESFQKGFEEGETNAKARRAKPMKKVPAEIEEGKD